MLTFGNFILTQHTVMRVVPPKTAKNTYDIFIINSHRKKFHSMLTFENFILNKHTVMRVMPPKMQEIYMEYLIRNVWSTVGAAATTAYTAMAYIPGEIHEVEAFYITPYAFHISYCILHIQSIFHLTHQLTPPEWHTPWA